MSPYLRIRHKGGLGNKMFQYMLAKEIMRRVPGLDLYGIDMPEWGIGGCGNEPPSMSISCEDVISITGHRLDLSCVATGLASGRFRGVESDAWGCRVEYYNDIAEIRALFPTCEELRGIGLPNDKLLVNVRAAEILRSVHHDYVPTPIRFIESVVEKSGLQPVFMGQLGEDWYSSLLKKKFKGCEFIPSQGARRDFEVIRQSVNVVIPISTFSWLAAWLSEINQHVYLPVLGMFNPLQRPDVNLLPVNDDRYLFYGFPYFKWRGDRNELEALSFRREGQLSLRCREPAGRLRAFLSNAKNAVRQSLRIR